ncbi:MAG: penicillin acylase family protein [Ignavibacteria bacterium]|nr:penicillin acylase family protein [Ignavibacteria bacterium]
MTTRRTIAFGVAVSLAILAVAGYFALRHVVLKSLPETEGTLEVDCVSARVEIRRDGAGIPHIFASSDADLYAGNGYVHAQDRLWQMDLLRRYGRGRLAEIFGARALPSDRLMRTLGIGRIADSLYSAVSPETRRILGWYADGVNACMRAQRGRYPVEFDLLQYAPEPWTPQDCLVIDRLMGWELALSWWSDLLYADLVLTLGEEKAREAFPRESDENITIASASLRDAAGPLRAFREDFLAARAVLGMDGSAIGSNCWAVTKSKSATGLPLLANDPHLLHMQPARWYLVHLSGPGMNVAGAGIPGTPGVVIGHNDHLAWGVTNGMIDDADFALERVSFKDSTYEYRGSMRRLGVRVDSILVRDSSAVELTVYSTARGPIINGAHPSRPDPSSLRGNAPVSLRWTGFEASDEIRAIARMNRATDIAGFREALRDFGLPCQNFTVADRGGSIAYQLAGLVPLRDEAAATLPSNGWEGAGEWRGFLPFDALPALRDPADDMLASANNRIMKNPPAYLSRLWESDSRISRIRDMLAEQKHFAAADFRFMQMDVRSNHAASIRDDLVRALGNMPGRDPELTRVLARLERWDLRMTENSVSASIFNAVFVRLLHETFEDEMGPQLFSHYLRLSNIPVRVLPVLLADTATTWFDDVRTPGLETRDDILRKSVLLGVLDLARRLGPDMNTWTWGRLHTVTFKHPVGEIAPLDRLFNVGPLPVGGQTTTVNNGEYALADPFRAVVGPSLRIIMDLAALDTCLVTLTTGQSGQPLSAHYSDMAVLMQNGAYQKLISNVDAIRRSGWETRRWRGCQGEGESGNAT